MRKSTIISGFSVAILCFMMASACSKYDDDATSVYSRPQRLAPYLFETTYQSYDRSFSDEYFQSVCNIIRGGACSVVRNGDLIGRNFDFHYGKMAEFVVHVPASQGRFASIGVAAGILDLHDGFVESGAPSRLYDYVPYSMMDGINEKGLYCSINMVPTGDKGYTTGTNPGAPSLAFTMVVRVVLDNCSTALEACRLLERYNISSAYLTGECHYFVADRNESYIIEFFDNKMIYERSKDNILTNYYVLCDGYTPHSQGIERFNYVKEHRLEASSPDGMSRLLSEIRYSYLYDLSRSPIRYSDENEEEFRGEIIDINTPKEIVLECIRQDAEKYRNRDRDRDMEVWITCHSSIYDLGKGTLRVYAQENYDKCFEFSVR